MKKSLIFIYLCLFFLSSCKISEITNPIIIGKIIWNENTACKYYNEKPQFLIKNIKISLKDLDIPINSTSESKIFAGYNKFKINVRLVKTNITEVKIHMNSIEDKTQVKMIFNQIDLSTNTINYDDQGKPTKFKKHKVVNQ